MLDFSRVLPKCSIAGYYKTHLSPEFADLLAFKMAFVLTLIKHFLLPSVNTWATRPYVFFIVACIKKWNMYSGLKNPYFPMKHFYNKIYTFHIHIIKFLQLFESIMLGDTKCSWLLLTD